MGFVEGKPFVVAQWMKGDRVIVYANPDGKKYSKEVPVTPLEWQPKWSER